MKNITATLKPRAEKAVRSGHPWIFSGAIDTWSTPPTEACVADIVSSGGEWLARGLAGGDTSIAVRIYTQNETDQLDTDFFARRLDTAIAWREQLLYPAESETDSFRLCFSESDGLSGLIVDRYAGHASVESSTPLLAPHLPALVGVLNKRGLQSVDRNDTTHRMIEIKESGFTYRIDPGSGQKTGFYLDQRANRRRAASYAAGRRCLSAYCYTGGFEMHLARSGASTITGIDSSASAIELAKANHVRNNSPVTPDYVVGDVPGMLRKFRDSRTSFDMIVLDPPKFVANRHQLEKGLRAYKDINLLAMKLLTPGGILVTFSCSGWVKAAEFRTALDWAALDAGRNVQILEHLTQPPDHPILLSFPESDYLCGYIMRVE